MTQDLYEHMNNKTIKNKERKKERKCIWNEVYVVGYMKG
jgi:hypothetical protein